jgi:hypothetical protein
MSLFYALSKPLSFDINLSKWETIRYIGFILGYCLPLFVLTACQKESKRFVRLSPEETGIYFNNDITENDTLNILNSEFVYNGGGVAVGDLNGDGLQDLYFTGNQVENKLYLNRGNLRFEDITEKAYAQKRAGQWSAGVNLVDINADGRLDIYVCNTFVNDPKLRENLLFINMGNQNTEGVPQFTEQAAAYGLADTTHAANAQFFDYDNDGDLDVFIGVNYMDTRYPNQYFPKTKDGTSPNCDRLYRNDFDPSVNHPVFTDVSRQAGMNRDGYSHSSLITDFNHDGWLDIYVSNDYVTNDLVYINNQNGSFTNQAAAIFKHQANSSMGSDLADVNNDGLLDMFATEMLPYYNKRKKLFLNANNYTTYLNNDSYGYEYQFTRNVLQINRGMSPETGLPIFSDAAFLAEVQETEWSWTPLLADFDNDGNRDIFITNGFPRDVTDHDFGAYRGEVSNLVDPMTLQNQIPQIKVPKFLFRNEGDLHFKDVSKDWGVDFAAFTNGAAYADLDNDGDLDLVANNMEDAAFVFKNTLNDANQVAKDHNYCRLIVKGEGANRDAFGLTATAYFGKQKQVAQLISGRGYLSSSENIFHFGLGKIDKVDSVVLSCGNYAPMTLFNLQANQTLSLVYAFQKGLDKAHFTAPRTPLEGGLLWRKGYGRVEANPYLFEKIDPRFWGLNLIHRDSDFIDFNFQKTLPHKFSQYGPSLSVGDINGDGRDDIYMGGSALFDGIWLIQNAQGQFSQKLVGYKTDAKKLEEELGTLLFDADNDGDNDLYIVRGSGQYPENSTLYQDVLCVNDGKGNFKIAPNALPKETACGQAVKAADYDGDGDLDLFVGGRVLPNAYPKTDRSFILRNDTRQKDTPQYSEVTAAVCPELSQIGLVTDALWTDFDKDNRPDLIVAGEWMSLQFFKNEKGILKNITAQTGIADKSGWWNSLAAADFDNDGDTDYMAGNFGENTYFKCTTQTPLSIYAKDFDNNGLYDPFISCYWRDSVGNRHEYFYHSRDDMIKQLVLIRRKFQTYGAFGMATVKDVFSAKELEGAQILRSQWLSTSYIENLGHGQFKMTALPTAAQLAPVYGMLPYDVDGDELLDLILVGNDYGMELLQGRADAFNGLVLKNNGGGKFQSLELDQTGFYVPHDARALVSLSAGGKTLILASQNRGTLKAFLPKVQKENLPPLSIKGSAVNSLKTFSIERLLKNGQKRREEYYWGSGFLSQSSY